jgi:DNA invertase Pin-like site-specific DNA recombinase
MPTPIAYSYLRFSTPEQMRGDSFRRQSALAKEYAARHGLKLDETLTFQDLGVSAFHGRNAEAGHLGDFLGAVRSGVVAQGSYLLVESLDRISRQTARRAINLLGEIVDGGVTLVTLTDSRAYTSENLDNDPMALMMALLIFIRANEESATKSRRIKAAWEAKRATVTSKPLTARCPAWLRIKEDRSGFELIEERAAIVRRVYQLTLEGRGQHLIADTLNRDAVPTWGDGGRTPAGHWHRSYIVKLLSNPATYGTLVPRVSEHAHGKRVYRSLDPVKDYYPGAITEEIFQRVQALRSGANDPRRGRHATSGVKHLLAGLAKCPLCGGTMTRISKGPSAKAGRPYLVCQRAKTGAGCEYRAIPVDYVDRALGVFGDAIVCSSPASSPRDDLNAKHSELTGRLDTVELGIERLVDAIAQGESAAVTRRLTKLEAEREQLRTKLRELREQIDDSHHEYVARRLGLLMEALMKYESIGRAEGSDLVLREANARLRETLKGVTVDYNRGVLCFDWKHGGVSEIGFAETHTTNGKLRPLLAKEALT